MLLLDETPYHKPREALQVAPTSTPKAAGMAALKFPVDVAAAGLLIAGGLDEVLFGRDNFFKLYEEEIKPIQDKLTPEPGSVSDAGRFIAGIAGFAPALTLGPAGVPVLAGTSAMNTGAELVEQGVDPETATGAAILTGAAGTAMAGIPAAGKTWSKTLALAATNPVIGAASTEAEKQLLEARGYEGIAEAYDPLDPVGRGIDAVLGVAFGAMGKYAQARNAMKTRTRDSIDAVANWQHMVKDTPFGEHPDLAHKAMSKALSDISQGKPVDLSGVLPETVQFRFSSMEELRQSLSREGVTPENIESLIARTKTPEQVVEEQLGVFRTSYGGTEAKNLSVTESESGRRSFISKNDQGDIAEGWGSFGATMGHSEALELGMEAAIETIEKVLKAMPVRAEAVEAKAAIAESLEAETKLEERRIDAGLRQHVKELMGARDFEGVLDLVYKDPLTQTYNQKAWKRLEESGDLEGRAQGKSDLKKFKYLNDTYGDAFGDEVIAKSGEFLAEQPNVKVFRIGGDETAVVSTRNNPQDVVDAYENANRKLMAHVFTGKKKDGTLVDIEGVDLVYGTGRSPAESAASRAANKQRLIDAGQYSTGRGDKSLSLVERARGARPDAQSAEVPKVTPSPGPPKDKSVLPLPLTESKRHSLEIIKDYIERGEAAIRRQTDYEEATMRGETPAGRWERYEPNPFPEYFKGKGYRKKETGAWLNKALAGEPLTERQRSVVDDLLSEHRSNIARQFMNARAEMKGYGDLWNEPAVQHVEQRFAEEGDFRIHIGTDVQGEPATVSAREFINQAKEEYKAVEAQKDVYSRIADCQ